MNYNAKKMLEVEPKELRFIFELKKQSTCFLQLTNNTDQYVAFKVKTTTPKKYCVRPNVGVIMPQSDSEISVIMQAQKVAPMDMVCKDKFLVQSTIVPVGATENDITADMFVKDNGKHIEEIKLKVALLGPHQSPVPSPINRAFKREPSESRKTNEPIFSKVEILTSSYMVSSDDLKLNNEEAPNVSESEALDPKKINIDEWEFAPGKAEILKTKKIEIDDGEFNVANEVMSKPKMIEVDNQEFSLTMSEELKAKNVEVDDKKFNIDGREFLMPNNTVVDDKNFNLDEYEVLKPKNIQIDNQETSVAENDALKPRNIESDNQEFNLTKDNDLRPKKAQFDDPIPNSTIETELKPYQDLLHQQKLELAKDDNVNSVKNSVSEMLLSSGKYEEDHRMEDELAKVNGADEIKLVSDIEEMKSRLNLLESKLNEGSGSIYAFDLRGQATTLVSPCFTKAESTISRLTAERKVSIQARKGLQEELVSLRSRTNVRRERRAFPLSFVIMVALVSMLLGYLSRS